MTELFYYEVPDNDTSYIIHEIKEDGSINLVNKYPHEISFLEKYKKPLAVITNTYYISNYLFKRKNPFEYNFATFDVFQKEGYVFENHYINGGAFDYCRHFDGYLSYSGRSVRNFKETPGGRLYFKNKKDLAKFKLLLTN